MDNRWHGFYLNYSSHFLVLRKRRVFSTGPQILVQRLAPIVEARKAWQVQQGTWVDAVADDGFNAFIQAYAPLDGTLPQMCQEDPLALERAMELLEGTDGSPSDWYQLKHLRALKVADEDSLRRVTVSQENDRFRAGVIFRRERARKARVAAGIPGQPLHWPRGAADLADGFRFRWTSAEPNCNVEPFVGNGGPATFVFLGDEPDDDVLSSVHAKISKALRVEVARKQEAEMATIDASRAADRLCIVYRRNNSLASYRPSEMTYITESRMGLEDDIAGGGS